MRFEEQFNEKQNIKDFYDDFVRRTQERLNRDQQANFTADIEQKLKQVNVFERNEKQNELIIRQERNKLVQEMEEHVEKCPYKQCRLVFEQVIVYGVFAGSYKQDPCSFVGYRVYESTHKTDCPYGSKLNANMLQTHRLLKEESYKELRARVI